MRHSGSNYASRAAGFSLTKTAYCTTYLNIERVIGKSVWPLDARVCVSRRTRDAEVSTYSCARVVFELLELEA